MLRTTEFKERYIDPKTDFGFKYLFGTDMNKDLLIDFLNALFNSRHKIEHVTFLKNEHLSGTYEERRAIFDVYCETDAGEKFIVEMQNVYQQFFKDRSIYYSTFPIREQAQRGDWNFRLEAVYTIGILNFVFDEDKASAECVHHEVKLMDTTTRKVFFDKLTFIYLELPKFTKTENELETSFDKWIYVLKNLSRLLERPAALQERIFTRLFEAAEIARFTPKQQQAYEDSIKAYRDITNAVRTAKKEGIAEGKALGLAEGEMKKGFEIAQNLKRLGISPATISQATGLSEEEINDIPTD